MRFFKGRDIKRLALPITRRCNRSCPECPAKADSETPMWELEWVGEMLGPIDKIEVTGGEPSLHPDFVEISENLHNWFDCQDIMLLTNGYLAEDEKNLPVLLNYDRVYVSHYTEQFADRYGTPTNTEVHDKIRDYLKDYPDIKFWSQTMDYHIPIGQPPYRGTCTMGYVVSDMIGYSQGRLYGCCVSIWLDDHGKGIPLTKDWRGHLEDIWLPCDKCFISGQK